MGNYYSHFNSPGVFMGKVLLQDAAKIGGARSVFVDLEGVKNELTTVSWGGQIQNPFKAPAKYFAGDLFEMRYDDKGEDPKLYLLKTFEVKSMSTKTVTLYRDGYKHVPCVGDVLMKAPTTMGGQGKAYTVQSVKEGNDGANDIWTVVFNTAIDECTDHDILVEAEAESVTGKMLLKTINTVAPCDGDFVYQPATAATNDAFSARYLVTPVRHGIMYIHKMSPMPKCVLDLNRSRFNGWYEV